jgi:hypothetical protein
MMLSSWPCKVSYEIHINGQRVSEPVQEDKGKVTVPKSEDEKDPKRTCMVLSKGHKVVRLGYSRLSGDATRVIDKGRESDNPNWVDRVRREYDPDRRTDRVTQDIRSNRDGYSGWQGQTGLLRTAGLTETTSWVSRQFGLLGLAEVTETATRSQKILARLRKIWLTWKAGLQKIWYYGKLGYREVG